jgi:hypothetical protein
LHTPCSRRALRPQRERDTHSHTQAEPSHGFHLSLSDPGKSWLFCPGPSPSVSFAVNCGVIQRDGDGAPGFR